MLTPTAQKDLEIGDIIRLSSPGPVYGDCTVFNIDAQGVHVVRPYVHTADFICTAGVITYLGEEKFILPANDGIVFLLSRNPPELTRNKVRAILDSAKLALDNNQIPKAKELLRQL